MESFYIVSDVHIGNHRRHGGPMKSGINQRCQQTLDVFGLAAERCKDVRTLIIAGDLMDSSRPSPQELAAVARAIYDHYDGLGLPTIIVGNHEKVSDSPRDHSLGVFETDNVVHETPYLDSYRRDDTGILYVPHRAALTGIDALKNAIANVLLKGDESKPWPKHVLMVCHTGIEDDATPPWLKGKGVHIDALRELCVESKIEAVVAGDWHEHRFWRFEGGLGIIQCGALVPTGWDNPSTLTQLNPKHDPYGSLICWDPGECLSRQVIPGPRFVKTKKVSDVAAIVHVAEEHGHQLYLEVISSVDDMKLTRDRVREAGWEGPLDVTPDKRDVDQRTQSAALSVTNASNINEAVGDYVATAVFDGEPDRDNVAKLAMSYLKG